MRCSLFRINTCAFDSHSCVCQLRKAAASTAPSASLCFCCSFCVRIYAVPGSTRLYEDPDVDEYSTMDDVGYLRRSVTNQQEFIMSQLDFLRVCAPTQLCAACPAAVRLVQYQCSALACTTSMTRHSAYCGCGQNAACLHAGWPSTVCLRKMGYVLCLHTTRFGATLLGA